jgi:hypothetical protein
MSFIQYSYTQLPYESDSDQERDFIEPFSINGVYVASPVACNITEAD